MVYFLTSDDLPILLNKLTPYLRTGKASLLKVYGVLNNTILGKWSDSEFVVDQWPDFTTVIVRPKKVVKFEYSKRYHFYHTVDLNAFRKLITTPEVIDWTIGPQIFAISPSVKPFLESAIKNAQMPYHFFFKAYLFPYHGTKEDLDINLPKEYHLGQLNKTHAKEICAKWKYGRPDAVDYLKYSIHTFPSAALFDANNKLVAYVMTLFYGAMSIIQVDPEYRKKKLSKIVLMYLIRQLLNEGIVPYGEVELSNRASYNLQKSLGMEEMEITETCYVKNSPDEIVPSAKL